jgi:hypothetical protein
MNLVEEGAICILRQTLWRYLREVAESGGDLLYHVTSLEVSWQGNKVEVSNYLTIKLRFRRLNNLILDVISVTTANIERRREKMTRVGFIHWKARNNLNKVGICFNLQLTRYLVNLS